MWIEAGLSQTPEKEVMDESDLVAFVDVETEMTGWP